MLGISGISSDMRDVENAAWVEKNQKAQLALDKFHLMIKRYIGGFMAELGKVDVIVFTAGVGENAIKTREIVCSGLEHIGLKLDLERNQVRGRNARISTDDSPIKILLITTNEELVIARDSVKILNYKSK